MGTTTAELAVFDGAAEVLFDANGKIVSSGGGRIQLTPNSSRRTVALLVGHTYNFKITARDGAATPNDLAYGEKNNVAVTGATTLTLNLKTLLGAAQLSQTRVQNGAVELALNVSPKGRPDLAVPEDDYTVSYAVTGGTILTESKLGLQIQPTEATVKVVATVSGSTAPNVDGTVTTTLTQAGDSSGSVGADLTSPTVAITTPADTASVNATTATTITGTATDNAAVSRVEVYDGVRLLGTATLSGTAWSIPWTPDSGSHTVTAVAYDAAGNTARAKVGVATLDPTFGLGGNVNGAVSSTQNDIARDVLVQSDGRILLGGIVNASTGGGYTYALSRLNANGTLDTTFGTNGRVTTDFDGNGSTNDDLMALAQQSDGRIIAVGQTNYGIAVARYTSTGALEWKRRLMFGTIQDQANSVALQADGKILVAGITVTSNAANTADAFVTRLNPDGSTDTNFGSGGLVKPDFNGVWEAANAVTVQSDGKILVAASGGNTNTVMLYRLTGAGAVDTTFGTAGKVSAAQGGADVYAMVVQPDGKIVTAGNQLARFTAAGQPDATFGTGGFTTLSRAATDAVLLSDGRIMILAGGFRRFTAEGAVDATFGGGGFMRGGGNAVAVQPDDKVVVAGSALVNNQDDFFSMRILP
ncbi:Ig-like domain-containing protein [Deinococcus radiotolerans]|uniref:Bacterial Ig-like domain-containing protein n=1 Tax=Deinococcus radiotolerans TaxID=1309407 RepID=A0ABQ2FRS2_9DEIO|nr:Ig-like domain-containing protein [Deinococcus radiotolerans]GGL20285.1 hypothetical protein GCM10010844_43960 [Deinococcus radiotolerans]